MNDNIFSVIIIGSLICCVALGAFFITFFIGSKECSSYQQMTLKKTQYDYMSGCYIEIDGSLIPIDTWKVVK